MLIEITIAILLGIIAGTFTGLIPGIHVNLVGVFLVSISAILLNITSPLSLAIFIVALAITHTFIDFIPSILLGCPDTDTELSVLPGHELLKQGKGYEAILLTTYGSISAIFLLILISIPFIIFKSPIASGYYFFKPLIPGLLILSSLFLISLETHKAKAILSFTLTGILGLCVLNFSAETLSQPLLPLLSGLFGGSMLILSIKNKTQIPKQEISKPEFNLIRPLIGATLAAPLCSFLPGLGSGQAAIIGNSISKQDKKGFLVLLGATNTLVMGFSFVSLYLISKTRTGAAVAIQQILKFLSKQSLLILLATTIVVGIIAFFLTIFLAKQLSTKITNINYTKLSIATLIILSLIVILTTGLIGFIILIASTLTGIYCISLGVRRTHMMGCLIIPTVVWYLFG